MQFLINATFIQSSFRLTISETICDAVDSILYLFGVKRALAASLAVNKLARLSVTQKRVMES